MSDAYRIDLWRVHAELSRLYGDDGGEVPLTYLELLGEPIEQQVSRYEIKEEQVEVALALVPAQTAVATRAPSKCPCWASRERPASLGQPTNLFQQGFEARLLARDSVTVLGRMGVTLLIAGVRDALLQNL
jgi:hypothetical protein